MNNAAMTYKEECEALRAEVERLKLIEESALKVCAELDSIVMVMPYDYLDPPDGGNVPMSEQISRMWSEVKLLRENVACVADLQAELAKYRDAPVVDVVSHSRMGLNSNLINTALRVGTQLIVKPGE